MSNDKAERVIFLDYDGVVNIAMWNDEGTKCKYNFPTDGKVNNFQAVQWISEFCQLCDYSIVVTSTWRKTSNWKECLINGGLRTGVEISGCTDITDECRGKEIKQYLKQHPEIKYYIIIDDDNDMLSEQQQHYVRTNPDFGFGIKEFKRCLAIYAKDKGRGGSFD